MGKHILSVCVGMLPALLIAQKSDSTFFSGKRKLEIGINVTSVISNFIGSSEDAVLTPGDFPLVAKYAFSPKGALRVGLGARAVNRREIDNNTGQNLISRNNTADVRGGYEWRNRLGKRWMAYGGIDGILGVINTQSSATAGGEKVLTRTNATEIGGGPVYGLQFAVNPRIQLGFEGSLYGFYVKGTTDIKFISTPDLDSSTKFDEANLFLSVPKWLYLLVRF